MSPSKKTALIIGGGFSGIAAAVLLDSLGFAVTLLEKKPILGGRAYAFKDRKTGSWVDNGQHLLIGAYHETIRLIRSIGAGRHLAFQDSTEVPLINERAQPIRFRLPDWPRPFNLAAGLLGFKALSLKDKFNALKIARALARIGKGRPMDDLTVNQWLEKMGQSDSARKNFWDILTLATLNDDPSVAQARMLAVVLQKGFFGSAADSKLVLPRSNLNDLLAGPAKTYLEMRGQTVRTGAGVGKIHVLDHRVQSVELDSGEMLKADCYLSSVPFSALLRLIPQGFVEHEPYFRMIRELKPAPIVSINFWFDRDVLPHSFVGVAEKRVHWYFNRNLIHGEDHPPYHYMGVVSGAYSFVEDSREEILKVALDEFYSLFPQAREAKLLHSLVNKEREATLSPRVGSDACRPSQRSPFGNFYVIGDWTATGYPATIESAVVSARLAADMIEAQFKPAV